MGTYITKKNILARIWPHISKIRDIKMHRSPRHTLLRTLQPRALWVIKNQKTYNKKLEKAKNIICDRVIINRLRWRCKRRAILLPTGGREKKATFRQLVFSLRFRNKMPNY